MFYRQSVDHIKLVILTLDGGLLDLNRLRYNYYHRTCEAYGKDVTKEQFSFMLGSMKTMYDKSPIQDFIPNQKFNNLVEKDLFEYVKLKQNIKKEGVEEFLQYCKQRKIKIAGYTTHRSKRAIQYLQLTGLYKKIDFLIGGDCQLAPLPKEEILSVICQQMDISPKQTLVVANFESMVEAAINVYANIIYIPDLIPANDTIKACVFKVAKNYLEVMNIFLFSKYDNVEMFSPILGMNGEMDRDTLYLTRNKLLDKYQGDEQLIALVDKTYEYFIDKINKEEISEKLSDKQKIYFAFDDDDEFVLSQEKQNNQEKQDEQIDLSQNNEDDITKPFVSFHENNDDNPRKENSDTFILSGATSYDPQRMNELMDIINGHDKNDSQNNLQKDIEEHDDEEDEQENTIYTIVINIIFNFLLAIIIVLIALIINLSFHDFLNGDSTFAKVCLTLFNGYMMIIDGLFGTVLNSLHNFITAVPSYSAFVFQNNYFSSLSVYSILSVIFNFIVICIIRFIVDKLSQRE